MTRPSRPAVPAKGAGGGPTAAGLATPGRAPQGGGLVHPMLDRLRLLVVSGQIEPDPAGDVLIGPIGGATSFKFPVVVPRVARPAEPRLDRGELGSEDAFTADHQGLQRS